MHAPGIKFGVVVAPDPSDRVQRITSKDPTIWRPAIDELVEEVWPRSISEQKRQDTERLQFARWGATGLAIIGRAWIDEETGQIRFSWANDPKSAQRRFDAWGASITAMFQQRKSEAQT